MRTRAWVVAGVVFVLMAAVQVQARAEYDINKEIPKASVLGQALTALDTIVDQPVNWPMYYGVQQTGEIITRFDCFGTFGEGYPSSPCLFWEGWPAGSFVAPADDGAEYLYAGAIWVGGIVGEDTLVSTAMDGWVGIMEMSPDGSKPAVTKVSYPTDFSMRAEFSDTSVELGGNDNEDGGRPHIPLNVRLVNRSHIWRTEPENRTVIYDLILTNVGNETIEDGYVGFFMDCDVCYDCANGTGYTDDIAGSIRSDGIAYIIDNDGDLSVLPPYMPAPRAFGFKFLASSFNAVDTSFNWWISNGDPTLDFGPRHKGTIENPFRDFGTGGLGTPARDDNKYYVLSSPEWDYDQIMAATIEPSDPVWLYPDQPNVIDFTDGYDARFLMSIGPFDLEPGQSQRLLYATFTSFDVHTDPDNIYNLPTDPEAYLAGLDLSSLSENGALSDSLGEVLLDPSLPPTGLRTVQEDENEVTVAWDPWCFNNIDGYRVYLSEVPLDSLPYPGVPAPWLRPTELSMVAYVGPEQTSFTFDDLQPHKFYFVNIAHQGPLGAGDVCDPLFVKLPDSPFAPQFEIEYSFYEEGQPVELNWSQPEGIAVDHYNIYRFEDMEEARLKYAPFYDKGFYAASIPPKDSFFVDGTTYYYYAMEPYAAVTPSKTTFTDYDVMEDRVYIVTAVDDYGSESAFSVNVSATRVEPRTQDVLVITHSWNLGPTSMNYDSVTAFYDNILQGYNYDLYDWSDTVGNYHDGVGIVDWHDFTRYQLVIVDDDIRGLSINPDYEQSKAGYSKYILSGGKLAYFGSFPAIIGYSPSLDPEFCSVKNLFIKRFFGIDSVFHVGFAYFNIHGLPMEDNIFAFSNAQPIGPGLPVVTYDTSTNRFSDLINSIWPTDDSPPSVSVFDVNETGITTHLFDPIPGVTSMNADQPVGVRTVKEHSDTYLFGFHLWYMEPLGARALIDAMFIEPPKVVVEPDTIWAYYAHAIDTMMMSVYIGDFNDGHFTPDINLPSVRLDGDMEPETAMLTNHPDFDGEVARFDFSVTKFIERIGPFYGTSQHSFSIGGLFTDEEGFSATVTLTLAGKLPGDVNNDGQVDLVDLLYLVAFLFQGGSEPVLTGMGDVDGDGACGVSDVTYLVNYLYLGGSAPVGHL